MIMHSAVCPATLHKSTVPPRIRHRLLVACLLVLFASLLSCGKKVETLYDGSTITARLDGTRHLVISDSVRSIGEERFRKKELNTVRIPSSVQTIEKAAFARNQLTSVTIPSSVTSIGEEAFQKNNWLQ